MKIVAITGSRDLPESHAAIVAACIREADFVYVGCAEGADQYARYAIKGNQVLNLFSAKDKYPNFPKSVALAQRSADMVKAIPVNTPGVDAVLVGFPIHPCPAEIKRPLKSWQPCGSGTWSTIAMAAGRGIRVVVYRFGEMFLPVWAACTWVKSTEFADAWELEVKQASLF